MPEEILEKEKETPAEEVVVEEPIIEEPKEEIVLPEALDREVIEAKEAKIEKEIKDKKEEQKLPSSKERQIKIQKEIDTLIWKKKTAQEELDSIEQRKREALTTPTPPPIEEAGEVIVAGGKKWYTNVALRKMLNDGVDAQGNPVTADMVEDYRDARNTAVATESAKSELKKEEDGKSAKTAQEEEMRIRSEDGVFVKENYEWINDINDPRYKECARIWKEERYDRLPKGLSKAAKEADENYKKGKLQVNREKRTEELGVESPSGPPPKETKITLTEYEKDSAHSMFPNISKAEAEKKYANAKARRGGK